MVMWRDPSAVKGTWEGSWASQDKEEFVGTFTTTDGRKFEGKAEWLTHRETHIHDPSHMHVLEVVRTPMRPVWEYTGTFMRRDGLGATAPFQPEPPELRDDGSPPPEEEEA